MAPVPYNSVLTRLAPRRHAPHSANRLTAHKHRDERFMFYAHQPIPTVRLHTILSLVLLIPVLGTAAPIVLDFESLSDLESVTTQLPGLTFTETIALEAGISLNEFEFPPASGDLVVSDDFGPIEILFTTPVTSFAGFFTYLVPLTVSAFSATDTLVDSASSLFATNLALSGDPGSSPNELLEVSHAPGISRVLIEGDPFGASFTLDDARYEVVPEPGTAVLLLLGLSFILGTRHKITG